MQSIELAACLTMIGSTAYWLSQSTRVSWYLGQYLLSSRISGPLIPRSQSPSNLPSLRDLLFDLALLFHRDWQNIRAGQYRMPYDLVEDPRRLVTGVARYLLDLPEVNARRRRQEFNEVAQQAPQGSQALPRYYLQNFHYQTDGYLSDHSARLYDQQIEVLFLGGADAMRRMALSPLAKFLRGPRVSETRLLDVACGTGRFLTFVKDNFPRLPIIALDLSRYYLAEARRQLRAWSTVQFVQALAESMPLPDRAVDVVTCTYLFHEVPREQRRTIAAEIARVLTPGGRLIFADSLQMGDRPWLDGLLDMFPKAFHEPYYADYAGSDLVGLFNEFGLRHVGSDLAFLSKVLTFDKPPTSGL